ncbi:MAG: glycyl radical protein [Desulfobacteraceae bacterium]|nr:MAG: glycyl radical protein [Desulfobacteraceae bacterium]
MNQRIETLKHQTKTVPVTLSHERAVLVTEFYQNHVSPAMSIPVQRALCLKHILENKVIHIGQGELIVGERGPAPKAVPTYPEICLHTLEDLDILDTRSKIPYRVSKETRILYKEKIIPFWKGKTIREKIFAHMDKQWIDAFGAGIFTEFQEQRSPGHTAGGDLIYHYGFLDLKEKINETLDSLNFNTDPGALDKKEVLTALSIAADALISYALRHAEALEQLSRDETDPARKNELEQMAQICRNVPARTPATFHEALQYYWFLHVGVITELNPWDAYNPGRFDQNLYPFYKSDIESGTMTTAQAKELLSAFWIKFHNHPAPPKVGVTAKESNTYVDFCLINLGGVTPDNRDGVNDLSYLTLDVIEEMRLLQPSSMIQVSRKNPDRFIKRALKIIATGFGQPSVFNTDAIVQEMIFQGKSMEDARKSGASGCVEAGAFGMESYILTGYFNLPKILEITLYNGVDPRTGKQLGLQTGDPASFSAFDDLFDAFKQQLNHFMDIKIRGNNIIEQINARFMPVPLLSLVTEDCISKGLDYNQGGARYNTSYVQGVGLGSVTDSLSALNHLVFETGSVPMDTMIDGMKADFESRDILCRQMDQAPKYGNDDDRADRILRQVFDTYYHCVNGRPNTRGGQFRVNLLPTTCHVYFGEVTGAMPDGRRKGRPLSEGISPVQGADRNGPTAVLNSAAKIDHLRTGGTLLNQKFLPDLLKDDKGFEALVYLIRAYFKMDGHHVQFNVVDKATLEDAKKHPENHQDLIVRVAGYSDYFVDLTEALQDEIIGRTAHQGV